MLVTGGGKITCPRCTAMSKRSGEQCRKPALRSKAVCDFHGGRSTGPKTEAGKARVAAVHTVHGRETREQRAERSAASARISRLEDAMHVLKMITAPRSRGHNPLGYVPLKTVKDVVKFALDNPLHFVGTLKKPYR